MENEDRASVIEVPSDAGQRIRAVRGREGLTQTQLAARLGVAFATVNRWENEQAKPTRLAWRRILELEKPQAADIASESLASAPPSLDFGGDPEAVAAVAEAHRLSYGHLFNPAFATETSLIDPLPHQRIAVYQHMLRQSPLRYLLADDAGAGKTIMSALYIREMLARRVIRRVLIVPPAGLVGNWERELRMLFQLPFRVVRGPDAKAGNPFAGREGDHVIISIDTLAGDRMFARLRELAEPYDLVVFDEAHKLSADREPDFRVRKTDRYRLAEALAGVDIEEERWQLGWSAHHLLLLTATPHMGKDYPYFFLWRLLCPDILPTIEAFREFPHDARARHFIRRTKEEMVHADGRPLYPQRICDTLSYDLGPGADGEQGLYDDTTDYIRTFYNRARILNRSAARLAMTVFQRRLASSTYALLRSFERRLERLNRFVEDIRAGRITEEDLQREQRKLETLDDAFEATTADEDADPDGGGERHEEFESEVLAGTVATTLAELEVERQQVAALLEKARRLYDRRDESKFERLRELLRTPEYSHEKFIIFTEHRDTAHFLVRRLEGLGFTGKVAQVHGGMDYVEREKQVEFFRRPAEQSGAQYLVATDAAGEGINLQFCWLMVNYDIPWNPARLEQRMGRIHRYGQKRDPVVIANLIAVKTREGKVLKTLLEKLEAIRKQLRSDKVFDVVGRLFEGVSMAHYFAMTLAEDDGVEKAEAEIQGRLSEEQLRALAEREQRIYGEGGDVRRQLPALNDESGREQLRRLLPGYVRRFVERAAPLLDLAIDGDLGGTFSLVPLKPGALDRILPALEKYGDEFHARFSVGRPTDRTAAIWVYPGEPVFDALTAAIMARCGRDVGRGTIFVDPTISAPYLFHLALLSVKQRRNKPLDLPADRKSDPTGDRAEIIESRLVGLRQSADGKTEEAPIEQLLLLRGTQDIAPGSVPLAALAGSLRARAEAILKDELLKQSVARHRQALLDQLPGRIAFVSRGFDHRAAELAEARANLAVRVRDGDTKAKAELDRVKERQRRLTAEREARIGEITAETEQIEVGESPLLATVLVVPSASAEERKRFDAEVEATAMQVAMAYEIEQGATVHDVSKPRLARSQGLPDCPGFDLLSLRPKDERRPIEVKGRAAVGGVEITDNEWAKACNLRDQYWLYVVFDCATPQPRLVRVRDPFGALLARAKGSVVVESKSIIEAAEI